MVGVILVNNSLRTPRAEKRPAEITEIVEFVQKRLGFEPDAEQKLALRGGRRGIVLCTRQWGKSTVMAAKDVHRADTEPGNLILLLAPLGRQSGGFLRKARAFVARLDIKAGGGCN